ncbi:MAG: hypothetical protein ACYS0E_15230 [Planctomycetota bacterium]|jgi:hypothetical protein
MRKLGITLTLAAVLFGGTACGGGGGDNLNVAQALQNCMGDGMGYMLGIASSLQTLEDLIQGEPNVDPNRSVLPHPVDENSWTFEIRLDLDDNGEFDTLLDGTIAFSADPTDGIEEGDTAMIDWNASGGEGLSGAGSLNFTYGGPGGLSVWGAGTIDMPGQCATSYDISSQSPLNYGFPVQAAANVFGEEIFGSFNIMASYGSHDIVARVILVQDDNTISVQNAEIDGVSVDDFEFEAEIGPDTLFTLAFCGATHANRVHRVTDHIIYATWLELNDRIDEYERGTVAIRTVGTFSADFEITLDSNQEMFSEGTTIDGNVTFSADPVPGTSVTATVRFLLTEGDGLGTMFNSSIRPLVIYLDNIEGDAGNIGFQVRLSGRVIGDAPVELRVPMQLSEPEICRAVFTIPDNTPRQLAQFFEIEREGQASIESTFRGHHLRSSVVSDGISELTIRTYLDGIPIPGMDLLFFTQR